MSRNLPTCNISSKSMHVILLTDRQTDRQTNERGQTHLPPPLSEVIKRNQYLQAASLVRCRICENHIWRWINRRVLQIQHQSTVASWLQPGIRVDNEETNVLLVDVDLVIDNAKLTVNRLHEVTCSNTIQHKFHYGIVFHAWKSFHAKETYGTNWNNASNTNVTGG